MGYSSEEIISITTLSPPLFNLSKEKIKEKIALYSYKIIHLQQLK